MEFFLPVRPQSASSLGMALVVSSPTPLILLDDQLVVKAASGSFCRAFAIDCDKAVGQELFALGEGEWDIPQLRSLLTAAAAGKAAIEAYELELKRAGEPKRQLLIHAHVLDHAEDEALRLVVAITDVSEALRARLANEALEREKHRMVEERQILLQELNHRVANSLQIIASVLMLRVRASQHEETRTHLRDAHHRVLSVATLQRQLASTATGEVALRPYFTELCASIGASMIHDPALLSLTVDADNSVTTADRSVSMGLIITELVINALKHAYPGEDATGTIKIGFQTTADGWTLSVADDGRGLQGDHHSSNEPGLGTGIVNALAAQLSATVAMSDAEPGCVVSISGVQ